MGQTEKLPKIDPMTMNVGETKWDRIPPVSRTFLGGVRGPSGVNWVICEVRAPCMLEFPELDTPGGGLGGWEALSARSGGGWRRATRWLNQRD